MTMTSAGRLSFAAHLKLPPSGYVCLNCQLRASAAVRTTNPPITLPFASRRHASWIDTDKLRKKIWGTETPPGQEDPYGKESVFDAKRREREQEREKSRRELKPGPSQEVQKRPEDQTDDGVKATTTEGLETAGGPDWETEAWEEKNDPFEGFMVPQRVEGRVDTILAVHRALVETYALKEAGLPLVMDYKSTDPTEDYAERVAEGAKFDQDATGQTILVLESEELRKSILDCVTPQDRSMKDTKTEDAEIEEEESTDEDMELGEAEERSSQIAKEDDEIDPEFDDSDLPVLDEESSDAARSKDLATFMPASDTWRDVLLDDTAVKFAVLKRVMQLTGTRIPDPDIATITTPRTLLVHLVKKPKPKKIAEALRNSNRVTELPNVQILDKRYGPMDRETEVGRWKVIKEELEKRGLPIFGSKRGHNALKDGE